MGSPVGPITEPDSDESSSSRRGAPRTLGEYRLLKRLGAGGMGQVYKGIHRRLEKLVAIKLLPVYKAGDPRALARFDREIKAAGRVNHANVVQALDAREIDGTRFLVMEFVDGVNLSLLVRTCGRLEIADACELTRQAALGLQAAHEHGLVHRDIKPSNLMLSRGGQLKILDLGLARFRAEPVEPGEVTEVGETIGTAEYIAPEQVADSHRVDIRADIYSLGCSLYRLLTGQPPFYGAKYHTAVEKMVAHLKEPPPSVIELRSEISEPLAAIVQRMMTKDPDDRYATPAEVAAAIEPYAAGSDLTKLLNQYDAASKTVANADSVSWSLIRPESLSDAVPASSAEPQLSESPLSPKKKGRLGALILAAALLVLLCLALVAGRRLWSNNADPHGRSPNNSSNDSGNLPPPPVDLCGKELPQNKWIDVLPYTDLERDRVSDFWETRDNGIGCDGASGYPRFALPVGVHGDYDLEVVFTRNTGEGLIRILMPLGDQNLPQLLLATGDGRTCGFNDYKGHSLTDGGTPTVSLSEPLTNGTRYTVLISVRLNGDESTIDVKLDGEPLIHCMAPPSAFPPNHIEDPANGARPVVGVQAGSDVTFHSARLRMLNSKGTVKNRRPTEGCSVGKWVDVLPHIDLARDRLSGRFSFDGTALKLSQGGEQSTLMLPVAVCGSYELEMEFAHWPATGMISFIVPVGPRRVRVNPDVWGELHPDAAAIYKPASGIGGDNAVVPGFEEGVRHKLNLKVYVDGPSASIAVQIDGKPCVSWAGALTELHDGPILLPEGDRIGLVANGTLTVYAARLRVTSGKGAVVVKTPK
jgi:serine/threonine protein kinase